MKAMSIGGAIILALGLLSLFVPIPSTERGGISVGDVSIGVQTRHSETVAPIVSGAAILAGVGMLIFAKTRKG